MNTPIKLAAPKALSAYLKRRAGGECAGLWYGRANQSSPAGTLPSAVYRHPSCASALAGTLADVAALQQRHNPYGLSTEYVGRFGQLHREVAPHRAQLPAAPEPAPRPEWYGQRPPLEWTLLNIAALSGYSCDDWQLRNIKATGFSFLLPREVDPLETSDAPPADWVFDIWCGTDNLAAKLADLTGCVVQSSYSTDGLHILLVADGAPLYGDWHPAATYQQAA